MTSRDIVQALAHVPEKRLSLVELAWQCVGTDGSFDLNRSLGLDIETAVEDAHSYRQETERVRWALKKLMNDHS